jgi:hypothetical protein
VGGFWKEFFEDRKPDGGEGLAAKERKRRKAEGWKIMVTCNAFSHFPLHSEGFYDMEKSCRRFCGRRDIG